jgi:hypothetical protein
MAEVFLNFADTKDRKIEFHDDPRRPDPMKTKILILCGIVFLILGNNTNEDLLFYFFALYVLLLFIAVIFQRHETKKNAKPETDVEPLPETESSDLQASDAS